MSIHDRPTVRELIDAVRSYLLAEVAPATADRRARFRALIAANVLAVVERELAAGTAADEADAEALQHLGYGDRSALCAAIRAGTFDDPARDPALLAYVRAHVLAKLVIANPAAHGASGG